jgi:glycosyltransferase involved in cell wall biosynthesis
MKSLPRISVITPSFNQAAFIEQTILSVIGQGYPNLEYIVIDGGSTDGSVDVIRKFQSSTGYWVSEKDRGPAHAINQGLERATGDIIGYFNSDDSYLDDALARVADRFSRSICCMVAVELSIRTALNSVNALVPSRGTMKSSIFGMSGGTGVTSYSQRCFGPSGLATRLVPFGRSGTGLRGVGL